MSVSQFLIRSCKTWLIKFNFVAYLYHEDVWNQYQYQYQYHYQDKHHNKNNDKNNNWIKLWIKIKIVIIVITIIIVKKKKIKIKINSEKYSKIKLEGRHLPCTFDISSFSAANSWSAPREKN